MHGWLEAFPEYKGRDLFLVGESYAGVYVPMLAQQILRHGGGLADQLKGLAVGDGCTNGLRCVAPRGPYHHVEFFHGHGQFSTKTYNKIHEVCKDELWNGVTSDACKNLLDKMNDEVGYYFAYSLYDECYDFALADSSPKRKWYETPRFGPPTRRLQSSIAGADNMNMWHMDGSPCGGTDVLPHWVSAPGVKKALHVSEKAAFFTGDNGVGFTYHGTEPDVIPFYKEMAKTKRLRVLIYNGDTDPGLNSFVGENWTVDMGLPEREAWRPWTRDGKKKMGGYVTRYQGDFDYLTIRGSGHMVPEYKPEAASIMLEKFIKNEEYPRYVARQAITVAAEGAVVV